MKMNILVSLGLNLSIVQFIEIDCPKAIKDYNK